MKNYTLFVLICLSLITPSLFGQTTSPAIPEEARKHFVMGTTLFKDAKTADDYSLVVNQFKQAADLAPQWPDARYNLALAKEAAGDYSGAMADLKIYLQFTLSEGEGRTAQDKIYALEAKLEVATKKQAGEEQKKRDYQNKIGFLAGQWNVSDIFHCSCAWDGKVYRWKVVITIKEKNIFITTNPSGDIMAKGTIEGDDYTSIKWMTCAKVSQGVTELRPDYPVNVTIDKSSHQIHWKEPSAEYPASWTWVSSNDVLLTQ